MNNDFSKNTDKEINNKIAEWSNAMFTETEKGADINSIMRYTPLIQLAQNELNGRYVKITTRLTIAISTFALIISIVALLNSSPQGDSTKFLGIEPDQIYGQ